MKRYPQDYSKEELVGLITYHQDRATKLSGENRELKDRVVLLEQRTEYLLKVLSETKRKK